MAALAKYAVKVLWGSRHPGQYGSGWQAFHINLGLILYHLLTVSAHGQNPYTALLESIS